MRFDRTVLQVVPELDAGGAERTAVEIARAIVGAGGRALVATAGGRLEAEVEAAGGEIIRMPAASKNPATMAVNVRRLMKVIAHRRVHIVHARSRAPGWSAFLAAKWSGVAFATTVHGAYSAAGPLKRFYNSSLARGELVIANSAFTADWVRRIHRVPEERLAVIPRGADLERFNPAAVSAQRVADLRAGWNVGASSASLLTILLPARLTEWKGHLAAIEALGILVRGELEAKRLAAGNPLHLQLVFAGDAQGRASYVAALEARAQELGVSGMLKIVGHCADMPAAYAASDIVIAPSIRPEAFGRIAAEAGAMQRPAIVSDAGALKETIVDGKTGLVVAAGDALALARAIAALALSDPADRAAMGARARARVASRFSAEAMAQATLSAYDRLLKGAPQNAAGL